MTTASLQQPSMFSVFRKRSFTLLWTGQLVSTIGDSLNSLAAGILVYRLTGSAFSVGLMLMATALPTLFVGLVAGVFVDRYDRKRIMLAADLSRAVLVFLIPFLVQSHIAWLYIIVALSSAVGQFFSPAYESVLPEVASDEELAAANSFIAISSFGSTAIGFAASGFIAAYMPIEWAFYLDAVSFLLSALCVFFVPIAKLAVEGETDVATIVRNLKAGAQFIVDSAVLRSHLVIGLLVSLSFGLWNVLLLPFALRALHATEFEYGLQEGLTSVGYVIASLLMARLADRLREGQWITIGLIGMGLVGVAYALATSVWFAIAMVTLSGFLNAPYGIARRLIIQRNTPREVRGRVNSAFFVTRDMTFLVGMSMAGLADVIDVRVMMLVSVALVLLPGVVSLFLPGLGQPAAEWKRAISLLRAAKAAPRLGVGRAATLADFDLLTTHLPVFAGLSAAERRELASQTLVADAAGGTVIVAQGEVSNAAYFILNGHAIAGRLEREEYHILEELRPGDFFGEIAALTGVPRTANVIAEELTTLLQVPAATLRQMSAHPELNRLFLSKMTERMVRMNMIDLPRAAKPDQQALRELRTVEPAPAA
jgi:MFS family permease